MRARIMAGDARERLRELPDESVQTIVTSPPYWQLRDYGVPSQVGLEGTIEEHVEALVSVFRACRPALARDGTLWINYADAYACVGGRWAGKASRINGRQRMRRSHRRKTYKGPANNGGVKPKNLLGLPFRIAFALQEDGWHWRARCIWHKPNAMPFDVRDRPVVDFEEVLLFSRSERYFWSTEAVREAATEPGYESRHLRSVWSINTQPFHGEHFAAMPIALADRCVRASTREGDVVLDPFAGSGTTGLAALRLGRSFVGVELNPEYAEMARRRIVDDAPLFNTVECLEASAKLREAP